MGGGASQHQALLNDLKSEAGTARTNAIMQIRQYAFDSGNVIFMGSKESGLIPVLAAIVTNGDRGDDVEYILGALLNLTCPLDNRAYIGRRAFGLIPACIEMLKERKLVNSAAGLLWNLGLHLANAEQCVDCGGIEVLTNMIMEGGLNPYRMRSLLTPLMINSRHPKAGLAFAKIPGALDKFNNMVDPHTLDGLRCTVIVANMVGRQEGSNGVSLLVNEPGLSDSLVGMFVRLCSGEGGQGYEFMDWDLVGVLACILNLSVSDANKAVLVGHKELLDPLIKLVKLFNEDGPGIFEAGKTETSAIGGGGKDVEVAENAVEVLLQLSFRYDDVSELQSSYMTSDLGIAELMNTYATLPESRGVSKDARVAAMNLWKRLQPKPVAPPKPAPSGGGGAHKHIMLSYCWAEGKSRVTSLAAELRALGYDTWRDEEGSGVIPAMSGATDDRMAEAIEASDVVIICISRQYKESANCRQEAKYANDLFKRGKLHIVYVMMDQNYHTRSSPDSVNGWLGIMVGDSLWYSLWSDNDIGSTATKLAEIIGDRGKNCGDRAPAPVASVDDGGAIGMDADCARAWAMMRDASKVVDMDAMQALLNDLGISEADELPLCEQEDLDNICKLLKKIPQKTFKKLKLRE